MELRKTLLLPLDDLLVVTREFIHPEVSRSGLDRCLRCHGVSNLKTLLPQEESTKPLVKPCKDLCARRCQVPAPAAGPGATNLPVYRH